jgi:hypothetical protein
MRHLRCFVFAAVAAALFTAPLADARPLNPHRHGPIITAAKPAWLGESWAQIVSLPLSENPFAGNGNPCLTVGHKVLQEIGGPCTMEEGWVFMLGFGGVADNVEAPFPQTQTEQCAVAQASDRATFLGATVSVDGGAPVDVYTPRFELCSPQRTVLLPADNIGDLPGPQIVTITAHGWPAAVRHLGPGRHTIVGDATLADGTHWTVPHTLIVVPRHGIDTSSGQQAHR